MRVLRAKRVLGASALSVALIWGVPAAAASSVDPDVGPIVPTSLAEGGAPTCGYDNSMLVIRGTSGDDVLVGTAEAEVILGLGGNDRLIGGGGADIIIGGYGHDILEGGNGPDIICGGHGNDVIRGDHGNDKLNGQGGVDTLLGGDHQDQIFGGDGADVLNGQAGHDLLIGGAGDDNLLGGWGNDLLSGGWGHDSLDGQGAADQMWGGPGNDVVKGGHGDDVLVGGIGSDVLHGGDHADQLYGAWGNDDLSGDNGNDTLIGGLGYDSADGGSHADDCQVENAVSGCETATAFGVAPDLAPIDGSRDLIQVEHHQAAKCASLLEGVPILSSGDSVTGYFSNPRSVAYEYLGYLWVPDGWRIRSSGTVEVLDTAATSQFAISGTQLVVFGSAGLKLTEGAVSTYGSPLHEYESTIDFSGAHNNQPAGVTRVDVPAAELDANGNEVVVGRYQMIGFRRNHGASEFLYDWTGMIEPIHSTDPAPFTREPCRFFQSVEGFESLYQAHELEVAIHGVIDASNEIVASLPLHSCLDSANGLSLGDETPVHVVLANCAWDSYMLVGGDAGIDVVSDVPLAVTVTDGIDRVLVSVSGVPLDEVQAVE